MVVDLTIKDDGGIAIVRAHRLIAERRKINDLEANGAERHIRRFEDALLVRPAMRDALDGGLNPAFGCGPVFMRESSYAAQMQGLLGLDLSSLSVTQDGDFSLEAGWSLR